MSTVDVEVQQRRSTQDSATCRRYNHALPPAWRAGTYPILRSSTTKGFGFPVKQIACLFSIAQRSRASLQPTRILFARGVRPENSSPMIHGALQTVSTLLPAWKQPTTSSHTSCRCSRQAITLLGTLGQLPVQRAGWRVRFIAKDPARRQSVFNGY